MWQLRGNINVQFPRVESVEIFGKCLPVPRQSLGHHDFGDIFHTFHYGNQHVTLMRLAWRKTDAAIAHYRCSHTVVGRWSKTIFPHGLPVIMGVDIDKTRSDNPPCGVDFFMPASRYMTNRGNASVFDRKIGYLAGISKPVEYCPAANHQIIISHFTSSFSLCPNNSGKPG